ncbi:MAG: flagellar basal body P-ring protein FlgI [Syntrophorhabdales bacterium]
METRVRLSVVASLLALAFLVGLPDEGRSARIKDIAYVNGVRPNMLIGYGLVVGLKRTGDKVQTLFTTQSLANMLERLGIIVDPTLTKITNVAAVMVTAELPAFARVGNKIDATVSSMGDAMSLEGGVLLMTPLKGADSQTYAVAQGSVAVGGFAAAGQGASVQKNHPTVGRITNGAIVERQIEYEALKADVVTISLKRADFTNVRKIVDRINGRFERCAAARDGGTITLSIPADLRDDPVKFLSIVENLDIRPENQAKIVVDEKTGTVVIGEDVRIASVAISHGNVSVQIKELKNVSQPLPFAKGGQTVVTPETEIRVEEEKGHWYYMEEGTSIKELVNALNAIGVSTRDVIVILQTIKAAGALNAELEII